MKAKLLKRMRKRFAIEYYPNREDKQYALRDDESGGIISTMIKLRIDTWHPTKERALESIISIVKYEYRKFSLKYKRKNMHTKVWP